MAAIMIKPQSLLAFYIQKKQILNQTTYEKSEIIIDFSDWFINFNCGINNSIMINISLLMRITISTAFAPLRNYCDHYIISC